MKIRVLGCSGAIAKDCRTTSFLIDGALLLDAGTGVGDLTVEQMGGIEHVLLTHSHLDHIAALPLMVDATASCRSKPLQIHALAGTIAALQAHIFNDVIWPDFSRLPTPQSPLISFNEIEVGQTLVFGDKQVEVLPAVHTVPAVGFAVTEARGSWVFSGDTGRNPAFWQRINQLEVSMLVIETAFSNREKDLAGRSLHLSPQVLAEELECIALGHRYPVYITHTKPAETALIMAEIQRFEETSVSGRHVTHDIRCLLAGQVFEL
jgi:ribonuclease BN (tRNA processing enzyme)